uniref:BPTI/Kunitz inhibitor domain-containing protein n=1 Tax=Terrapene triunguis TaxID=2587831 RepID=A0A674K2E1_9SAUR
MQQGVRDDVTKIHSGFPSRPAATPAGDCPESYWAGVTPCPSDQQGKAMGLSIILQSIPRQRSHFSLQAFPWLRTSGFQKICKLPMEPGPCFTYVPSYFYNSATKRCEQFIYGGCQGNANRFPNIDECLKTCGSSGKTARETQLVGSSAGQRDVNAKQLGPQRRISPLMTDWLHHSRARTPSCRALQRRSERQPWPEELTV